MKKKTVSIETFNKLAERANAWAVKAEAYKVEMQRMETLVGGCVQKCGEHSDKVRALSSENATLRGMAEAALKEKDSSAQYNQKRIEILESELRALYCAAKNMLGIIAGGGDRD